MQAINIFSALPAPATGEVFTSLLETKGLKIERIVSHGQRSPADGWYDQDGDEWVIVLQGEAVLDLEGTGEVSMRAGDYVNIPAHTRHRVAWTAPDRDTVWLAVHY